MLFILIGVALFFAAGAVENLNLPAYLRKGSIRTIGLVVIAIGVLTSCIKQIDAGEIGVQSLFGKVQDEVVTSGLNFVNPLMSVNSIDVRTQNYTMSGVHTEGEMA